ncbi:amino acid adenylation domain-containing protein [Bacteriovoracaceae bacterium]|nr:amino acid adenylation domain-containing protein [Bacteriovoracaceae bacterium]
MKKFSNLGQKFIHIANQYSENIAIRFLDGTKVSYKELDDLSNKYVQYLKEVRIKKGDCISLSSEKRIESYALIASCWKTGITYSFFDRFSPIERLEKILNQCNSQKVIGSEEVKSLLSKDRSNMFLSYEDIKSSIAKFEAHPHKIECEFSGDEVAYVMFTSGSTGIPKGVAIKHSSLVNFTDWTQELYEFNADDVFSHLNPLYFDNSVFDLYSSLFIGASLVAFARDDLKDPGLLVEKVDEFKLSTWFSVPSMIIYLLNLGAISSTSFKYMKRIIFGGEGFPKNKLKELFELIGSRVQLVNVYGPTEGTCICSSYNITSNDFSSDQMNTLAPLGRDMLPIFDYYILDENNKEVEVGEIGELALGGEQLSIGYVGNEVETSRSFILDPIRTNGSNKVYKTGDLVSRASNELIYFAGRKDSQIKFMGHRVELGEIESALDSLCFINESCVVFGGKSDAKQIVAYVSTSFKPSEIKKSLKNLLPPYMIPRKIRVLEVLPKNANGKIDRKALMLELSNER